MQELLNQDISAKNLLPVILYRQLALGANAAGMLYCNGNARVVFDLFPCKDRFV
jgi:hypothetical protein